MRKEILQFLVVLAIILSISGIIISTIIWGGVAIVISFYIFSVIIIPVLGYALGKSLAKDFNN